MRRYNERINKQPKTNYLEYETHEKEPKMPRNYAISSEVENELLDYSYFLKRRVWRQMKKVRKLHYRPVYEQRPGNPRLEKARPLNHKPAHIF